MQRSFSMCGMSKTENVLVDEISPMRSFFTFIIHELREVIYPVLFLFCVFELVAISNALLLESYSITPTHTAYASLGALIGGKAILVANKMSYVHMFRDRPVLVSVLWRSFIYALFCAVFLCSEHIVTGLFKHEGPLASLEGMSSSFSLAHVAANVIWLFVSLMLYNSYVEVDRQLGPGTLRRLFLGSRSLR
jgi:hypothetical protein